MHDLQQSLSNGNVRTDAQIVVALLSPCVGYYSEKWGRKPLLLLGFGLEIIRTLLIAFSASVPILLTAQLLGGISAAAVTVLTILVITDLTTGYRSADCTRFAGVAS